jgi:hypothetical protein
MATDLVEYFVVGVPDVASLAAVIPATRELARAGVLRLLDCVVVERDADGVVRIPELADAAVPSSLAELSLEGRGLLSEQDLALAGSVLPPGTAGLVVVTEDRWAEPLAAAMRRVGGRILAGERIPSARVADAMDSRRHQGRD